MTELLNVLSAYISPVLLIGGIVFAFIYRNKRTAEKTDELEPKFEQIIKEFQSISTSLALMTKDITNIIEELKNLNQRLAAVEAKMGQIDVLFQWRAEVEHRLSVLERKILD